MKKTLLILSFIALSYFSSSQDVFLDAVDYYYPASPFGNQFSNFLQAILNPAFSSDREIHKRTDTSLYYFKGSFKNQNPFSFEPKRIDVIIAEQQVRFSDTSKVNDTFFVYQVIAYTTEGINTVRSEFSKFERKFGKKFSHSTYTELGGKGNDAVGHSHNYFLKISPVSPLTVSWGKMNSNEYAFIVSIRFIVRQNEALLPYYIVSP